MTLIVLFLMVFSAITYRTLFQRTNIRITFVDILILSCGVCLLAAAFSNDLELLEHVLTGMSFFLLLLFIFFAGSVLITRFIKVPTVESAIRNGWIKVRPHILYRQQTTKAIVDHALAITQLNMPLAQGFFLASQQTPKRTGVVLQALANFLQHGLKLSEAYARYTARSTLVLSMIQAGERCGQLPQALQYLQDYMNRQRDLKRKKFQYGGGYPLIPLSVLLMVAAFTVVFVIPKFEVIFRDFGTTLPIPTQILIQLANFIADTGVFWLIVAVMVAFGVILRNRPRRYPRPFLISRLADHIVWKIPGLGTNRRFTDLAHAAAILRLGLNSGMTMPEAVRGVTDLDLNTILRRRFVKFHALLVQGEPTENAGKKIHLPQRFLWALRDGQDKESLNNSLELVERYYSLMAMHWSLIIRSILWPLFVILMGILVAMFVLAIFLPLVKLINAVLPY